MEKIEKICEFAESNEKRPLCRHNGNCEFRTSPDKGKYCIRREFIEYMEELRKEDFKPEGAIGG